MPDWEIIVMIRHAELKYAFDALGLAGIPVVAHASLKKLGLVHGGPTTVLEAMRESFGAVMMPTHTYKAMVTPRVGPPNNGMKYAEEVDRGPLLAEPFHPGMPADKMMGILPETLRKHPSARRSLHPILSFAGIGADAALDTQTLYDPLAPIGALAGEDGWVLLIGVDHTVNTSIHYAERLAGRKQFIRWALAGDRVVECPGYPGDSSGFQAIEEYVKDITRRIELGKSFVQAVPLKRLLDVTVELIKANPLALLCERADCERCNAIRVTET